MVAGFGKSVVKYAEVGYQRFGAMTTRVSDEDFSGYTVLLIILCEKCQVSIVCLLIYKIYVSIMYLLYDCCYYLLLIFKFRFWINGMHFLKKNARKHCLRALFKEQIPIEES